MFKTIFHIRTIYLTAIAFFIAIICFAAFYLASDYHYLEHGYLSLNNCFYKKDTWSTQFFSPAVKASGNTWCLLALVISFAGIVYAIIRFKKQQPPAAYPAFNKADSVGSVATILVVMTSWIWGNNMVHPAYDEIFSAVNGAGIHPFQTGSYYMLPNNHVFFNLVNNLVFFAAGDKVITGRIISLLAYLLLAIILFRFFSRIFENRIIAFISIAAILLQFSTWAFSFQARGYELQLLAAWITAISLYKYQEEKKTNWLRWMAFGSFIGYILIPSFLYFHAAILLFAFLFQLYNRKADLRFWKYMCISLAFVFLFYLPLCCFSGVQALSENHYVKPVAGSWEEFIPEFISRFKYYINYCFSFVIGENHKLNYLLFLLPGSLIFSKKRNNRGLAIFYGLIWLSFIFITLYMKRSPFARNLIIQYSLSLSLVLYTFYCLVNSICMRIKLRWPVWIIYPFLTGLLCLHFINFNREKLGTDLYYNDINGIYKNNIASINRIPNGSSIGFSEESFYWYYHCSKRKLVSVKCPSGNEDYFITRCDEEMPKAFSDKYYLLRTEADCYNVYRHK